MLNRKPDETLPGSSGAIGRPVSLPIDRIHIGQRHRHDLGDIQGLAQNIAEISLLHPIVVSSDNTLIAGQRRLAAMRALGWSTVPAWVVDLPNIIRGALAENAQRKDFLPSEIDAIRLSLEPIEKVAAKQRQREHGGTAPGKHSAKISQSVKRKPERAVDKIAAFAGVSGRTIEKIAAVCEAARRDERFRPLVEEMDRTQKVDRCYYELRCIQVEEEEAISIMKCP